MKDKTNIVVWSGGWDSTLVLDRICSANPTKCVWAFSVVWDMLSNPKLKKEKEARRNYLSYAKLKGYNIAHRTITVKANMGVEHLGHAQALAWFSYVIPYIPKDSILHFGYHGLDEFWQSVDEFDKYVKAAAIISDRKIALSYPLRYMSKCDILEEHKSRRIPSSCVWTCEKPKRRGRDEIISCGDCNPCLQIRTAKYESKLRRA